MKIPFLASLAAMFGLGAPGPVPHMDAEPAPAPHLPAFARAFMARGGCPRRRTYVLPPWIGGDAWRTRDYRTPEPNGVPIRVLMRNARRAVRNLATLPRAVA